jgi:hypothetical protein
MRYLIAVAAIMSLTACSPLTFMEAGNAGNPNAQPYVGAPGSAYDQAANPPSILGTVKYNPDAPLPPADMAPLPNGQPR